MTLLTKLKEDSLGMSIEPTHVRLITNANDPYSWKVRLGKEHLFKKQLSKHSIGAYMELCRGVGVSFQAVVACLPRESQSLEQESVEKEVSSSVTSERNHWRDQANHAEEKVGQLTTKMQVAEEQHVEKEAFMAECCRKITIKSLQDMNRVFDRSRLTPFSYRQNIGCLDLQGAF